MLFKSSTSRLAIILISFFLAFHSVQSDLLLGYEIRDLDKNNEDSFIEDASAWTISQFDNPQSPAKYNRCGDTFMLGGPGILASYFFSRTKYGQSGKYYERVYNDLPQHNTIRYSFRFWAIGNWETSDSIEVHIDGVKIYTYYLKDYATSQLDACGESTTYPKKNTIANIASHSSDSVHFKFVSQINKLSKEASFGFRDLRLLLSGDSNGRQARSFSGSTPLLLILGSPSGCPDGSYWDFGVCMPCPSSCPECTYKDYCFRCSSGYYFDGNDCKPCANDCATCSGPNKSDCKECNLGYMLVSGKCLLPCASLSDYRYENGACLNQCSSSLITKIVRAAKFCLEVPEVEESRAGVIIGASVSVVVAVLAIAIYLCIRRRRILYKQRNPALIKKEQKNQAEPKEEEQQREHTEVHLQEFHAYVGEIIERPVQLKDLLARNEEEDSAVAQQEDQIQDNLKERANKIKV